MPENEKKHKTHDIKKAKKIPPPEQRRQIWRREPLKEIKKAPPPERRKIKPKEERGQ